MRSHATAIYATSSALLEDGYSRCEISREGKDRIYTIHSPVSLLPQTEITLPKINWDIVRAWLQVDTTQTTTSSSDRSGQIQNLIVIDCKTWMLAPIDKETDCITLSYVWDRVVSTDQERPVNRFLTQLPPTIEDSLQVCLELGYRYLWVDRYCIPQDDLEEQRRPIHLMDVIYASSALTIVACAGHDPQHGLPGVTKERESLPSIYHEGLGYLQMIPSIHDIRGSVWASRAWTYQETLLSNRRLYFTGHQLYFERAVMATCEWVAQSSRKSTQITNDDWLYSVNTWLSEPLDIYKCIKQYTERRFTYDSDALNAFLGVQAVYERKFQIRHLWGLPYSANDDPALARPNMIRSLFFGN